MSNSQGGVSLKKAADLSRVHMVTGYNLTAEVRTGAITTNNRKYVESKYHLSKLPLTWDYPLFSPVSRWHLRNGNIFIHILYFSLLVFATFSNSCDFKQNFFEHHTPQNGCAISASHDNLVETGLLQHPPTTLSKICKNPLLVAFNMLGSANRKWKILMQLHRRTAELWAVWPRIQHLRSKHLSVIIWQTPNSESLHTWTGLRRKFPRKFHD